MPFTADILDRIDAAQEVDIETTGADGRTHRTIIWIMVEEGAIFVRSVRGDGGRWYQRAVADPSVAIHVDGERVEAIARAATDEHSVEVASAGLRRKYRPGSSLDSMLVPSVLPTTLRLDPVD